MNIEANCGPDMPEVEENAGRLALALLGGREEEVLGLSPAQRELRRRVLAAVTSPRTRRSYGEALDDLFRFLAGRPLSRSLLQEWKTGMGHLAASTINVRLAAVRKMIGEAEAEGAIGVEEAARLTGVPNVRQPGLRLETGSPGSRQGNCLLSPIAPP